MTLLIGALSNVAVVLTGALSNVAVVLTADGRCRKEDRGTVTVVDNLQKIFPLPGVPLAVAHHGQNIMGGRDIKDVVSDFTYSVGCTILREGPRRTACALKDYLDDDARTALSVLAGDTVIGFWLTGFGAEDRSPTLYEVCWESPDEDPEIERHPTQNYGVIWGGSGERYVTEEDVDVCMVSAGSGVGTLKQRCDELYRRAEQRQKDADGDEFAGHKHQLSIKKTGWHWYLGPPG